MKKHIHLIVPDKFKNPLGGMGVGARNFVDQLKGDFDFSVIGFPEENDMERYSEAENPMPAVKHGSLVTLFGQSAYFNASLKLAKPDIIHAYDWSVYLGAYYTAQHFKVPLVVSMRLSVNLLKELGIYFVDNPNGADGFWIEQALCEMELFGLTKADHITQVSIAYADKFNKIPGLAEKTTVVPNGIDLSLWQEYEKIKLPGSRRLKVVYIGRFVSMKGIEPLCKAKIPDDIDLIFIGGGEGAEKQLVDMVHSKVQQNDNVHYIGPKYGKDKINILGSADAIIMPSVHEPFGIVALEALASGSILLSSFVDGMGDFLTKDIAINCGIDTPKIEQALERLVLMDEQEKKVRIDKGFEVARNYSWKVAAQKMKEVYEKVLNKAPLYNTPDNR